MNRTTERLVDYAVAIPSYTTACVQEASIVAGHCFCELAEGGLELPGPGSNHDLA